MGATGVLATFDVRILMYVADAAGQAMWKPQRRNGMEAHHMRRLPSRGHHFSFGIHVRLGLRTTILLNLAFFLLEGSLIGWVHKLSVCAMTKMGDLVDLRFLNHAQSSFGNVNMPRQGQGGYSGRFPTLVCSREAWTNSNNTLKI